MPYKLVNVFRSLQGSFINRIKICSFLKRFSFLRKSTLRIIVALITGPNKVFPAEDSRSRGPWFQSLSPHTDGCYDFTLTMTYV